MSKIYTTLATLVLLTLSLQLYAQEPQFEWAKSIGSNSGEIGHSVALDLSGNVYTTGRFKGTVDFDPGTESFYLTSRGDFDAYIQKLDLNGDFIWVKRIGGPSFDFGYSIALDQMENIYITGTFSETVDFDPAGGTFNLTSYGNEDAFILKLDSSGDFQWARGLGGMDWDSGFSVDIDDTGNAHITGSVTGHIDFNPSPTFDLDLPFYGDNDIFIMKLDSSGNLVWIRTMGGSISDQGSSVAVDRFGNVYTTGYFFERVDFDPGGGTFDLTSYGTSDAFILKLDSSGDFQWVRGLGGMEADGGTSIALDTDGNVYTTGYFTGTVDFNPGSGTLYLTSSGDRDSYIQKLNAAGVFLWAIRFGSPLIDAGLSITTDHLGNVYSSGFFNETVDFNPGGDTFYLTSNGRKDSYVQKLDADGNFLWARNVGGSLDDANYSITVDQFGYIHTTGYYREVADFDPTSGIYDLHSAGSLDIFITKWSQGTTSSLQTGMQSEILLYPNPTPDNFRLDLGINHPLVKVEILTSFGQVIFSDTYSNTQFLDLEIKGPTGLYLLKLSDMYSGQSYMKVVKGKK